MKRGPDPWLTVLPWIGVALNLAATYVLMVRTTAWVTNRPPDWGAALGLLAIALLFPVIRWDDRERFGGRQRWTEYRTALRTGALPADAEPDQWLPRLGGRMAKVRGARRVAYPAFFVLFALWITLMVFGRMGWEGWLVGVALVLALALADARGRWVVGRLERLMDQLSSSAGESAG